MNAIEIRNLSKSFRGMYAVDHLYMTVPVGAIYGFIGENGSGKSTTEKLICGLILPGNGQIKLFGRPHTDADVRAKMGVLIESPGCFPNLSVWKNMKLQAANLGIKNPDSEIIRILKMVRMEGAASNKYKNCSLGMKQRIGIAMALLGNPTLLVLDEPINGLDADGMRIMREVLCDLAQNYGVTIVISSHILGELEKIATHYGIIRGGKMMKEMTAEELEKGCRTYTALQTKEMKKAKAKEFESFGLGKRLKTMTSVDFGRMFTTPFFYIMLGISFLIPILVIVSVLVCLFVAADFRSGYAKNLFTIRAKKTDYMISKTLVCFVAGAFMLLAFFIGTMLGGLIMGLPFDLEEASVGSIVLCMICKVLLMAVFVPIYLLMSVIAKQKSWLSILLSLMTGMFLFMMIPMLTPLNATIMNVILCLAGGAIFSVGLGAIGNSILKKKDIL